MTTNHDIDLAILDHFQTECERLQRDLYEETTAHYLARNDATEARATLDSCNLARQAAEAEVARLREALQWYADMRASDYGIAVPSKLGERAREALRQLAGDDE